MSELMRLGGAEVMQTLQKAASRFGDGKTVPVGPNGRMRHCARCERLRAEYERYDRTWTPNICHSWVSGGRRYWASTCLPCGEIEAQERLAAKEPANLVKPVIAMPRKKSPAMQRHLDEIARESEDDR